MKSSISRVPESSSCKPLIKGGVGRADLETCDGAREALCLSSSDAC